MSQAYVVANEYPCAALCLFQCHPIPLFLLCRFVIHYLGADDSEIDLGCHIVTWCLFPCLHPSPVPHVRRFLGQYLGEDDSEIDLGCHGEPEFSEYQWMQLEQLPGRVSWGLYLLEGNCIYRGVLFQSFLEYQ